jgi:hypothetical protein
MFIPENNIRLELELLLITLSIDVHDAEVERDIDLTLRKIIRVLEIHTGMTGDECSVSNENDASTGPANNSIFGFLKGE